MRILRPQSLIFQGFMVLLLGGTLTFIGARSLPHGVWLGLIPVVIIGWIAARLPLRRWNVARRGLPPEARNWLDEKVPFYTRLGDEAQQRFERDVLFFMEEQTFEGVQVEVDEQVKLEIAAAAAMLLHGRPDWEFETNRSFLIYPDRFDEDYYDTEDAHFEGMAHEHGPIILSRKSMTASWAHPRDGYHVVLHELAHLLDFWRPWGMGTPGLLSGGSEKAWETLMREEMRNVRRRRSLLRSYAATNEAEFFAVAVEAFYEQPNLMATRHPGLFAALVAMFHLDPRTGEVTTHVAALADENAAPDH